MIRAYCADIGNLEKADGSTAFSQGNTIVQAGVYGPRKVSVHKELYDEASIELTYKRKIVCLSDQSERLIEMYVKNTLAQVIMRSLHPRTLISIALQELHDDGSIVACAINAAFMALMDAGIPMKGMIAGVTAAVTKEGRIIRDPTKKQEEESKGCVTLVFDSLNQEIISVITDKRFTEEELENCIYSCRPAAQEIFTFYRESVTKRFSKAIETGDTGE